MKKTFNGGLILLSLGTASLGLAKEEELVHLTQAGQKIEAHYAKQLDDLRARLAKEIPFDPAPTTEEARDKKFDFPEVEIVKDCLLYTSPSPRDRTRSRMPSSA